MTYSIVTGCTRFLIALSIVIAAPLISTTDAGAQAEDERAFQFAERLYRDGLLELAYEQFERFADEHPRSDRAPQAMLLAADCLILLERMDDAIRVYDRAIERYRRTLLGCEASYKRATIIAQQGDHREALRAYDGLGGAYPDCARRFEAQLGAAEALIELGRPDEALARIAELPADPDRPGILARSAYTRASALDAAGEAGNALAAYDAVIQLFPATIWEDRSLIQRASILASEGFHSEAIKELDAVGGHGHEDAGDLRRDALTMRGTIYDRLGRTRDAGASYEEAGQLASDPTDKHVLLLRAARAYQRADAADEALRVLGAVDVEAGDTTLALEVAYLRAQLSHVAGRYAGARAALAELEARASADTLSGSTLAVADSLSFAALLLAAEVELADGNAEGAAQGLRTWPRQGATAARRAQVDQRLGAIELDALSRPVEARSALSRAAAAWDETGEQAPPELYLMLGRAEESLEHWAAARAAYHAAYNDRQRNSTSDEARDREAYVRDYLEIDDELARRELAALAEDSARGRIEQDAALLELARIHDETLKDYARSLALYGELIERDGGGRDPGTTLYRAGRSGVLAGHAVRGKVDKGDVERGHRYFAQLAEEHPEHSRADDARLALIEANASQPDAAAEAAAYQEFLETWPRSNHRDVALHRLATIYREAGDAAAGDSTSYAVARDYYASVLRDHAESDVAPESAYWRAAMDEQLGNALAAQSGYQDCLRLYPRGSWATEAHFRLGEIALENRRIEDATEHYAWIRTENPDHALGMQALARLGDCELVEKDYDGARAYYRAMLEEDPRGPLADQAILRMAESYDRQGELGESEAMLRRFLAEFPDSPNRAEVYRRLGALRQARGDHLGAADAWQRYLATDPPPIDARAAKFERASALRLAGENDDARNIYKQLAKAKGDSLAARDVEHARAEEAILLYDMDKEKDGRKRGESFAKDFPDSFDWQLEIAIARGNYLLRKDPEAAAAHFDAMLEAHQGGPGIDRILYGRGLVALGAHDFETAIDIFERLLREVPDSSLAHDAHFKLGTSFYSLENYGEASRHYRLASDSARDRTTRGDALHNLGLALERGGRFDEAIRVYRDMEIEFANSKRGLRAAFKVGFVYQEWHKYDQAIASYRGVLPRQSGADAAETQFWIAECFESKGDLEAAAAEYLKVGYLYPDEGMWPGTSRYRAGEVYEKLGRTDDAHAVYTALAREDPGEWGGRAQEKLRLLSQDGN